MENLDFSQRIVEETQRSQASEIKTIEDKQADLAERINRL